MNKLFFLMIIFTLCTLMFEIISCRKVYINIVLGIKGGEYSERMKEYEYITLSIKNKDTLCVVKKLGEKIIMESMILILLVITINFTPSYVKFFNFISGSFFMITYISLVTTICEFINYFFIKHKFKKL